MRKLTTELLKRISCDADSGIEGSHLFPSLLKSFFVVCAGVLLGSCAIITKLEFVGTNAAIIEGKLQT